MRRRGLGVALTATIRPAPATLVLGLGTLISHGFGLALLPAMLPRIAEDFSVGYGVLGTVTAAGMVAYTLGALAAGRILDRVASRPLMMGSFLVGGAGLLATGAATSPPTLAIGVLVLGFAAPVSWAVSLHVAGATVAAGARSMVMAGAASGAALGVLINGVLVQTSSSVHSWRVSFVIAAAAALVPVVAGVAVFRTPVGRPRSHQGVARGGGYRSILASRAGRVVVAAPILVGTVGFPFTVFLTATALDEMQVSSLRAALLWWVIGGIGTLAGPVIGRYGDRASPLGALAGGAIAFAAGLGVLVASWTYAGLVIAAIGLSVLYYPIWGLVGAVANRHFDAQVAVRAISLGLIGAAGLGAAANAAVGAWIDATSSLRVPVAVMAAVMAAASLWHVAIIRSGGLESVAAESADTGQRPAPAAYDH